MFKQFIRLKLQTRLLCQMGPKLITRDGKKQMVLDARQGQAVGNEDDTEDQDPEASTLQGSGNVSPPQSLSPIAICHIVSESEDEDVNVANEGFSDGENDVMDDIIENNNQSLNESVKGDSYVSLTESEIEQAAHDIINGKYGTKEPVYYLQPVSDILAKTITQWCRVPLKCEEVRKQFRDSLTPQNVEGVKPVHINKILYQKPPL